MQQSGPVGPEGSSPAQAQDGKFDTARLQSKLQSRNWNMWKPRIVTDNGETSHPRITTADHGAIVDRLDCKDGLAG